MKFFLALCFVTVVYGAKLPPFVRQISPEQVEQISNWKPTDKGNPWQMSGQTEGDMVLLPSQRNGLINTAYRWPGAQLVYYFDGAITNNQRNLIKQSLDQYTRYTCVTHKEWSGEADYIYVTNDNSGCWSYVGRLGGQQQLNLQANGCMYTGTIIHEFKHALGFYHQQSATERDDYVQIMWENIQEGTESNFEKYGADLITNFGTPYDYDSVMHYDAYAFSKNGQKTIVTYNGAEIGQRDGLSSIDIQKVNLMYC